MTKEERLELLVKIGQKYISEEPEVDDDEDFDYGSDSEYSPKVIHFSEDEVLEYAKRPL